MEAKVVNALRTAAMKSLNKKTIQTQLYDIVHDKFVEKKQKLINDFKSHRVSQEISGGESASNISNTLSHGNLFSFIGFLQGENPVEEVASYLEQSVQMSKTPEIKQLGSSTYFQFKVRYPGEQELKKISRMPWETGRSWLFAIEDGISGLSYYLYGKNFPSSRSSTGVQAGNQIHKGAIYKRTPYISLILNSFKDGWGRL